MHVTRLAPGIYHRAYMFERIRRWRLLPRPVQPALVFLLLACLSFPGCSREAVPENGALSIRVGSFTFASLASVMSWIIQGKGFGRRHGLEVEVVPYGSVSAYYAGLTSGEVDTIAGGPLVFQRMRLQGVPIKITNTYATLASLVVISTAPAVHSLADLRGKRLAADMGSSEYQILRLLAEREGLRLGTHVEVLQASPTVARAHLQSGEVQAILTFEPTASLVLREVPGAHIVVQAQRELEKLGLNINWLLVSLMREDWLERHPEGARLWRETLADAAEFVIDHPKEADDLFSKASHFPSGVLATALREGRVEFRIKPVSEEEEPLRLLFNIAQEGGFAAGIPGVDAFYDGS